MLKAQLRNAVCGYNGGISAHRVQAPFEPPVGHLDSQD